MEYRTLIKQNQHCSCYVRVENIPNDDDKLLIIEYCPKHKAVDNMYEALGAAFEKSHNPEVEIILMKAIAKAEGKGS